MPSNVMRVGNLEILALSDGKLEFDLCNFFPTIPEEQWGPYEQHLHDHRVRFNLGSYLIRSEGKTILVDTGLGPRPADTPDVPWGELLRDFQAQGVRLEEVDLVVMTHLHRDHVGWNLQQQGARWVPTFPNARYWVSRKDWDSCHDPAVQPTRFPNAPTCVWPLAELGLVEFMGDEHTITRDLRAIPTPGHTPGHMCLMVTSGSERAIILGDAAHSPVQLEEPEWCSRADMDPDLTRQTRKALIEKIERERIMVAAGHFPAPGFGRIVKLEGKRYWQGM